MIDYTPLGIAIGCKEEYEDYVTESKNVDSNHVFKYSYSEDKTLTDKDKAFVDKAYQMLERFNSIIPELSVVFYKRDNYNDSLIDNDVTPSGFAMECVGRQFPLHGGHIPEEEMEIMLDCMCLSYPVDSNNNIIDVSVYAKEICAEYKKGIAWRRIKGREIYENLDIDNYNGDLDWALYNRWDSHQLCAYPLFKENNDPPFNIVIGIPLDCTKDIYMKINDAKPLIEECISTLSNDPSIQECHVDVGLFPAAKQEQTEETKQEEKNAE